MKFQTNKNTPENGGDSDLISLKIAIINIWQG